MLVAPWKRFAKRMLPHGCAAENTHAIQAMGTRAVVVIARAGRLNSVKSVALQGL